QTSLSSHEVGQGYKDVKDLSATAKFKIKGTENEYFLGWTTTPWTIPANVALAVNRNMDYVKIKQGDNIYTVAEALADKVFNEDYEVVSKHKGSEFVGFPDEPLFTHLKLDNSYVVMSA